MGKNQDFASRRYDELVDGNYFVYGSGGNWTAKGAVESGPVAI